MQKSSWPSALIAVSIVLVCLLGCGKGGSENAETTNRSTPAHNSNSQPAANVEIAGNYNITGTNPNNTPYKGTLAIIKQGDVYQFKWNAGWQYDGVGVINSNVVAVSFTSGRDGKGCGVVNYNIGSSGNLDAKWGHWGINQSGSEQASRTSGSGIAGEYNTTGTNPDGKPYKGTMKVEQRGRGYSFVWSNSSSGFGVERGSNVV